jgi:hypothetical protein
MKKSVLVDLPIDMLWEFREFKRDASPAPRTSFIDSHNIDEVIAYIHGQGKIEPVELSVIGNRALLTDGNHRIVAAKRLGYTTVPVTVVLFLGEVSEAFYDHTLNRFVPLSKELEFWLRKIFL